MASQGLFKFLHARDKSADVLNIESDHLSKKLSKLLDKMSPTVSLNVVCQRLGLSTRQFRTTTPNSCTDSETISFDFDIDDVYGSSQSLNTATSLKARMGQLENNKRKGRNSWDLADMSKVVEEVSSNRRIPDVRAERENMIQEELARRLQNARPQQTDLKKIVSITSRGEHGVGYKIDFVEAVTLLPIFDGDPDNLNLFCYAVRHVLETFGTSVEKYLIISLAGKFTRDVAAEYSWRLTTYNDIEQLLKDLTVQYGSISRG